MKLGKKIPSLLRSLSKPRCPPVSRSNPSSFSSSSSSSELKETPKSVIPGFSRHPSRESDGWLEYPSEEVRCDFVGVFRLLDKDGDGKIARRELEEILCRLGSAPPAEVKMMVSLFNADGDGCITMEEFGELSRVAAEPAEGSELFEAFQVFDTDGDGRISAQELRCVLVALGDERCTIDDCRRIIRSFDSHGDGFVRFIDFERMMKQQIC